MKIYFYDIESLENVFTLANYKSDENHVDIYCLIDDQNLIPQNFLAQATDRIHKKNKNFDGTVTLYDLHTADANVLLAETFGLSDARYLNNPAQKSSYSDRYRLVCDTDTCYDEELYPYLMGYNSYNYDTTELALYLHEVFAIKDGTEVIMPTTAKVMRIYNDQLFSEWFKECMPERLRYVPKNRLYPNAGYNGPNYYATPALIRKNMLMSGRHIDVARLNEKQSKVGLKRILGMTGYQILESDKLRPGQNRIESADQLLDLIAYNVSDDVNLEKLFNHKTYKSAFILKKQLLKTYPDLVYKEKEDTYKPDISPETVRNDRLMIDSSSAQLSTKSLCPYGHLHDYDTVSFMYPSEAKAKEIGIPRINVLDEARTFFYEKFPQQELRDRFDEIYRYYKSIEGRNFNESCNYLADHGIDPEQENASLLLPEELRSKKLSEIPFPNTCMPYYNSDGTPSSCFVNFSTGGIHGAEYNKRLYEYDMKKYQEKLEKWEKQAGLLEQVKTICPDPKELKRNKGVVIDGQKYTPSTFLKPKATVDEAYYKDTPEPPKAPQLFQLTKKENGTEDGGWKLNKRYTYTSADPTQHEDFTSYYPNLLRMMDAFFNTGLGYDRYGEIFDNKTRYGNLKDDETLPKEQRDLYSVMREGTKLVLNSASGAADANFESNIRMNNKIISMRIIGQLFTWRIGQAQTIEGAAIISTNTDGLYSARLNPEHNNAVLEREAEAIHVDIKPEPIFLISKDSNNRAEVKIKDNTLGDVSSANGGTLACRKGPTPEKSLAHPAIIDWALTEYLIVCSIGYKGLSLDAPFDDKIGMSILSSARKIFNDDVHTLIMFQNVIASSPGSQRFVFAVKDSAPDDPIPMQHYNRCFIVKEPGPDTRHLKIASAKVITDAMMKTRRKNNERMQQHDRIAVEILAVNGIDITSVPSNKEATVSKINGVEESWDILVDNRDLHMMEQDDIETLLSRLDYEKYLSLLRDSFEKNWRNITPEWEQYEKEQQAESRKKKQEPLFTTDNPVSDIVAAESENKEHNADTNMPSSDMDPDMQKASTDTVTQQENTDPGPVIPIENINMPVMIPIAKQAISGNDIANGEHCLAMNGIRQIDAHCVLAKLLRTVIDVDIDA